MWSTCILILFLLLLATSAGLRFRVIDLILLFYLFDLICIPLFSPRGTKGSYDMPLLRVLTTLWLTSVTTALHCRTLNIYPMMGVPIECPKWQCQLVGMESHTKSHQKTRHLTLRWLSNLKFKPNLPPLVQFWDLSKINHLGAF